MSSFKYNSQTPYSCLSRLSQGFRQHRLGFYFPSFQNLRHKNKLIHMVQVAYTSIQSTIKISDILSDSFTLFRAFRHGCPLSMCYALIRLR